MPRRRDRGSRHPIDSPAANATKISGTVIIISFLFMRLIDNFFLLALDQVPRGAGHQFLR